MDYSYMYFTMFHFARTNRKTMEENKTQYRKKYCKLTYFKKRKEEDEEEIKKGKKHIMKLQILAVGEFPFQYRKKYPFKLRD